MSEMYYIIFYLAAAGSSLPSSHRVKSKNDFSIINLSIIYADIELVLDPYHAVGKAFRLIIK